MAGTHPNKKSIQKEKEVKQLHSFKCQRARALTIQDGVLDTLLEAMIDGKGATKMSNTRTKIQAPQHKNPCCTTSRTKHEKLALPKFFNPQRNP